MPEFAYTALDAAGATVSGSLSAASRRAAVDRLAASGRVAVEVKEGAAAAYPNAAAGKRGVSFPGSRVTGRQQAAMLRQVAVALQAGLNLLPALEAVAEQAESPALRGLVEGLAAKVKEGSSLSAAMREAGPRSFSAMQVSMVEAGEAAGLLDEVAASLADFAERDLDVREKLRSAAMYPMLVLGLGGLSIVVIVVFILPRIMETVNTPFEELPLPTRLLMTISDGVRTPVGAAALLGVAAALFLALRWSRTPEGARTADLWKLKLPVIGPAVKKVGVARFARALGTLTGAGIQVVQALRITRNTLGNRVMAEQVDAAADAIVAGESIAAPLKSGGFFPPLLVQVVAMGEKTGRLDELLLRSADTYDRETRVALDRVMSVLPALLIMILAVIVAFILAAALLPIMTMDVG
ncbi:type II secretion system F family protein [Phycisphaera mikurensis]|uniref:Putative type IV pilus assembly protein PilC n=1 Tax=Phycisphaera mikurensis (strain NBRC 102666 / KCTC 22515 / FYK2301M01) TaxID=1142394 RepID=I0IEZ9_PHYMF|nr:type II secretion system F family protein [Phycisphaera mikurensis]MBB6441631.1 type II secretory pathway component PulF [Phycisphaera mikurensis]BAM03837.1 putative type IV pilus assembly protein PilC [Phycisphaera mikurensis NBRC 102666]